MASCRLRTRKDGTQFYEIRAFRPSADKCVSMSWDVPAGWSATKIEKELNKIANEFECKVKSGDILTREERIRQEEEERLRLESLMTVKQYGEKVFMPRKKITFAENSRMSYQSNLDNYVYPVIGDTLLQDVTSAMINDLLTAFQATGKSHATCVKLFNILNGMFKMAFMEDTIPVNPMYKVSRPKPRSDEAPQPESEKALTAKDLNYVLDCVKKEPLKWQAYIYLIADTGMRRGEACALQWDDIDLDNGTVQVTKNLQYSKAKGVYIKTTKSKKYRTVDIGSDTISLLQALKDSGKSKTWVFTQDKSGDVMFPHSPTKYFKSFGDKYGIEDFHPHLLRHTSASIAITEGADVASVASRLGHADTAVTLRMYTHANQDSIRKAGQTVRDALKNVRKSGNQIPTESQVNPKSNPNPK